MRDVNWNTDRTAAQWGELTTSFLDDHEIQEQRRAVSWDRCDTDGFVSQWAHGMTSHFDQVAASLARDHGMATFPALFNLDGEVVSTHRGQGEWGLYWVLNDQATEANDGNRFVSESKAGNDDRFRANMAKKGYAVGTISCRAYPDYVGGGTGMASVSSVTVARKPIIDRLRAGDFQVVDVERAPWMD